MWFQSYKLALFKGHRGNPKACSDVCFFFFSSFLFSGHAHGIQKFLGQGLKLSHSSDLSPCSDNARSSTHCVSQGNSQHPLLMVVKSLSDFDQKSRNSRRSSFLVPCSFLQRRFWIRWSLVSSVVDPFFLYSCVALERFLENHSSLFNSLVEYRTQSKGPKNALGLRRSLTWSVTIEHQIHSNCLFIYLYIIMV